MAASYLCAGGPRSWPRKSRRQRSKDWAWSEKLCEFSRLKGGTRGKNDPLCCSQRKLKSVSAKLRRAPQLARRLHHLSSKLFNIHSNNCPLCRHLFFIRSSSGRCLFVEQTHTRMEQFSSLCELAKMPQAKKTEPEPEIFRARPGSFGFVSEQFASNLTHTFLLFVL